jgi:hypothetical protein
MTYTGGVSLTDNIDERSVIAADAIVRTPLVGLVRAWSGAAKGAMRWFDNNGQADRRL